MSTAQNRVLTLASLAGVLTSSVAAMTIWLLLRQPLAVADAVNSHDLAPLFQAVTSALASALAVVLRFL